MKHIKEEHGAQNLKCGKCELMFNDKNDLYYHLNNEHKDKLYKCNQCGINSITNEHLGKHTGKEHRKKQYDCNQCDRNSLTKGHPKPHTEIEHDDAGDSSGFSVINNQTVTDEIDSTTGLMTTRAHFDGN